MHLVRSLIDATFRMHGEVKILDAGGRRTYWKSLPDEYLREKNVYITIFNLPSESPARDEGRIVHRTGDACDMAEFRDGEFHIVHSNSVIEHVGDWQRIKNFARETSRVGECVYVQTPYYWFPVEPHYIAPLFHWLPRPLQHWLLERVTLGNRGKAKDLDEAACLMDDAPRLLDMRTFRYLYPSCEIVKERFCLFTKSLVAVRRTPLPRMEAAPRKEPARSKAKLPEAAALTGKSVG